MHQVFQCLPVKGCLGKVTVKGNQSLTNSTFSAMATISTDVSIKVYICQTKDTMSANNLDVRCTLPVSLYHVLNPLYGMLTICNGKNT